MSQQRLRESPEKTKQRIERCESCPASARSFQGGLHPILQLQRTIGNRAVGHMIQAKLVVSHSGDPYEREADRVAEQVTSLPAPDSTATAQRQLRPEEEKDKQPLQTKPLAASMTPLAQRQAMPEEEKKEAPPVQKKPLAESITPFVQRQMIPDEEKKEAQPVQMQSTLQRAAGAESGDAGADIEQQLRQSSGTGSPLPESVRFSMEPRFGTDFSSVRVHTGSDSTHLNRALSAQAFTVGQDIAPVRSESAVNFLSVQQTGGAVLTQVAPAVQRYEAGEHAQLGETQEELNKAFAPLSYTVKKGDRLSAIAKKFGITVAELKDANKAKLKKWPAVDGSGRMIEGFNADETVSIPQNLNDLAKAATKDKSAKFTVNGVVLDYGVAIAMGDLFESPEQMTKASPKELQDLAALIKREQSGGKPVTTQEWETASGGRYLKLAEKNEAHFAPPSAGLVTPSTAGAVSANHKTEWEKHHKAAIDASKSGDKDKALMTNAFGDHFLTDAFAAGHLVNKRDVMEQFKGQLKLDVKGEEFTEPSKKFFDEVANDAFTGSVKTEFSKYETYERHYGFHPDIDRVSRFSTLLQGIHKEEPDLLANAVAKGVHDKLNTIPGGLPVENAKGDSWELSGDGTLNAKTREIARNAVAQSQLNVISVYNLTGTLDTATLYQKVWDYTPKPSKAGTTQLVDAVKKGTDVASADLKKAVVKLIKDNYRLIIDELVKRKKLQKA